MNEILIKSDYDINDFVYIVGEATATKFKIVAIVIRDPEGINISYQLTSYGQRPDLDYRWYGASEIVHEDDADVRPTNYLPGEF